MYIICRHIKTNELRCESPAIKGGQFCCHYPKPHTGESAPNPGKPKAPALEINKVKKSRKMGCETVQRSEPAKNQQATGKTAQPHRNCETLPAGAHTNADQAHADCKAMNLKLVAQMSP